jgi:hypothetical protein
MVTLPAIDGADADLRAKASAAFQCGNWRRRGRDAVAVDIGRANDMLAVVAFQPGCLGDVVNRPGRR